ncbi:uncharacterized protein LOC132380556 isoform X1 [Hypanus sabinus]|uniref:uncharacterized protein LOC132380556 isoform X1 n=2 Tax=Hypanus sabinus TaxID=79690 RepID=UPI0028C3CBB1|nr:uncharacterized protein LOC132380556 isoform X1 [Hypanus sabinus]
MESSRFRGQVADSSLFPAANRFRSGSADGLRDRHRSRGGWGEEAEWRGDWARSMEENLPSTPMFRPREAQGTERSFHHSQTRSMWRDEESGEWRTAPRSLPFPSVSGSGLIESGGPDYSSSVGCFSSCQPPREQLMWRGSEGGDWQGGESGDWRGDEGGDWRGGEGGDWRGGSGGDWQGSEGGDWIRRTAPRSLPFPSGSGADSWNRGAVAAPPLWAPASSLSACRPGNSLATCHPPGADLPTQLVDPDRTDQRGLGWVRPGRSRLRPQRTPAIETRLPEEVARGFTGMKTRLPGTPDADPRGWFYQGTRSPETGGFDARSSTWREARGPTRPVGVEAQNDRNQQITRKRGKRAGLQARLKTRGFKTPLPSIVLANVQAIENKVDELRSRLTSQRELRDCCVLCLTETGLTSDLPDSVIQPEGFSIHRMDYAASSDENRGGGVCFLINSSWCSDVKVLASASTANLEYLTVKCRPFYLPREFTVTILTAAYIPPQTDTKPALDSLCAVINSFERRYPEALFIIAGHFNHADFRSVSPHYYQHVSFATSGPNTLDHCYTTIREAYRSIPRQHLSNPAHRAVFLIPAYRQKVKREKPEQKLVPCWSEETKEILRDCFESVDWKMFKDSAASHEEYVTTVTDFITKCVEDCVPKRTITVFPNQKPWMNEEIRSLLRARTAAFKSGDPVLYKKAKYDVRKAIKEAKRRYQSENESQSGRQMLQNLQAIMGCDTKPENSTNNSTSLHDVLKTILESFEQKDTGMSPPVMSDSSEPESTANDGDHSESEPVESIIP